MLTFFSWLVLEFYISIFNLVLIVCQYVFIVLRNWKINGWTPFTPGLVRNLY